MQRIVHTLLRAFAGRLSIAALVALSVGGLLSQPAAAQALPQDLTTQPQLTHKLLAGNPGHARSTEAFPGRDAEICGFCGSSGDTVRLQF